MQLHCPIFPPSFQTFLRVSHFLRYPGKSPLSPSAKPRFSSPLLLFHPNSPLRPFRFQFEHFEKPPSGTRLKSNPTPPPQPPPPPTSSPRRSRESSPPCSHMPPAPVPSTPSTSPSGSYPFPSAGSQPRSPPRPLYCPWPGPAWALVYAPPQARTPAPRPLPSPTVAISPARPPRPLPFPHLAASRHLPLRRFSGLDVATASPFHFPSPSPWRPRPAPPRPTRLPLPTPAGRPAASLSAQPRRRHVGSIRAALRGLRLTESHPGSSRRRLRRRRRRGRGGGEGRAGVAASCTAPPGTWPVSVGFETITRHERRSHTR